jgi:HAMP domain-containing protein
MSVKISDNTSIGLPLRNLIGLIGAIVVGAWFAFGVIERLNQLETRNKLFEKDLLEASVQKPIDQEQFMLLEWQAKQLEKVQKILEENLHTNVMLQQHEKEIEKLKKDVEKLKDSTRDIKFGNGNGNGKY